MVAYSTRSPGPVRAELRGLGEEAKAAVSSSAYWTSQSLWPEFWRQERRKVCEEWGSQKYERERERERVTDWLRERGREREADETDEKVNTDWRCDGHGGCFESVSGGVREDGKGKCESMAHVNKMSDYAWTWQRWRRGSENNSQTENNTRP